MEICLPAAFNQRILTGSSLGGMRFSSFMFTIYKRNQWMDEWINQLESFYFCLKLKMKSQKSSDDFIARLNRKLVENSHKNPKMIIS